MSERRFSASHDWDWTESNARVAEWLDSLPKSERDAFMENRRVVCERLGVDLESAPLAAGYVCPVPDDPMSDPMWRAAIERGQELAEKYGW